MARTVRREHRFSPKLRTATLKLIGEVAPHSRMRILAVAVMSNHLHIVAQQRDRPLMALMQPLLRRLALRLQRAHDLEGPVFWRPYASLPCVTPSHARNAIVYTHLNPVRAGLCDDPADYPWTSHRIYAEVPCNSWPPALVDLATVLDPEPALPLFATGLRRSLRQTRDDYRAFVASRLEADEAQEQADNVHDLMDPEAQPTPAPWRGTDWATRLSPLFQAQLPSGPGVYDGGPGPFTPDLATLARLTLSSEAPGVSLESIRGRGGGARATRLRHAIIRRLHHAGFRNVQIARFLGLSESGVSYALRKQR